MYVGSIKSGHEGAELGTSARLSAFKCGNKWIPQSLYSRWLLFILICLRRNTHVWAMKLFFSQNYFWPWVLDSICCTVPHLGQGCWDEDLVLVKFSQTSVPPLGTQLSVGTDHRWRTSWVLRNGFWFLSHPGPEHHARHVTDSELKECHILQGGSQDFKFWPRLHMLRPLHWQNEEAMQECGQLSAASHSAPSELSTRICI